MSKKRILIINSISLFPMRMASQDRVFKMVKRLTKDHWVDLATLVTNENELTLSNKIIRKYVNKFYPIFSINYNKNPIGRKIIGAYWYLNYLLFGFSSRYFYWGNNKIIKQLNQIITKNKYDIIQVEGWYSGRAFKNIPSNTYKVIDTHDVLFEKKGQELNYLYRRKWPFFKKKEYLRDRENEIKITQSADIVISLSAHDMKVFKSLAPSSKHILIPTGQDLNFYSNYYYKINHKLPTILFYGAIGSRQNTEAFFRLYEKIFPKIKKAIPEAQLLVLGGSPPRDILSLNVRPDIEITGFVKDVRPYISRSSIMILPMDIGAGFRSRVVEVMAMGVPVIGTHIALDSLGILNGVEGIIEDSDEVIAKKAIELLRNDSIRIRIIQAAKKFVQENLSIEATFGKLSKFYDSIPKI